MRVAAGALERDVQAGHDAGTVQLAVVATALMPDVFLLGGEVARAEQVPVK